VGKSFVHTLEVINYVADQQKGIKIPLGYILEAINLRLTGTLTISGGAASGTVVAEGPATLVKSIDLIADGAVLLKRYPMTVVYRANQFWKGTAPERTQLTTGDEGAEDFIQDIEIMFKQPLALDPESTLLDSRRYEDISLFITWGNTGNLITGGDRTLALTNVKVTPMLKFTDEPSDELFSIFKEYVIEKEITVTSADVPIDLNIGNVFRAIFFEVMAALTPANNVINNISLVSDTTIYHRLKMGWAQLQADNEVDYSLEAVPTGYVLDNLMPSGDLADALDTEDFSDLKLHFDVTKQAGTNKIFTLFSEIIPASAII